MLPGFLTTSLLFLSICSQITSLIAVTEPGCQRIFDVQQQEFGVVYEYFHDGSDASCAYEFRGEEGQRVMLAISHIGLLTKQPTDEKCMSAPQLTVIDVSPSGEETIVKVICDDNDAKVKGSFVSSANMAKVIFRGPSDNGILLLQFWFVQDVKLIQQEVPSAVSPVINTPDPTLYEGFISGCSGQRDEFLLAGIEVQCDGDDFFRPLQCSEWGSHIKLSRCICVNKITGKTNVLEPPYCLEPPASFQTRCLQELAEIRHAITLKETRQIIEDYDVLPPTCDADGNYLNLQCRYYTGDGLCACVDPFTGNITNLAPPLCEYPLPTEPSSTYLPSTTLSDVRLPDCFVFFCTLFCESGNYAIDEDGCQICACETQRSDEINETCPDARRRASNETIEQWELEDPSPPYSWIPECSFDLYTPKQSNHIAGYFCVNQLTGQPNGKEISSCNTYKTCVNDRTMGFSKALRKAGYKKPSKNVKALLSGPNANDVQEVWNLMTGIEREYIFVRTDIFVPRCNAYGDFNALQCNYATGNCWCVDIFGAQIEGSRRSIRQQVPDCTQYVRRPESGPVYLDGMHDFGFSANDDFGIYSTFDNFSLSDDIYYFWTKDGVPVPLLSEGKYSVNTWPDGEQLTIGLSISVATEKDQGSYRCNLVKSSTDYFYSSPPSKSQLFVDRSTSSHNYYNTTQCNILPCDKVCAYGYEFEENCPVCKCRTRRDINSFLILKNMEIEIASSFGTNSGRCEAKRQWILKNIKKRSLTVNQDAFQHIDIPPECDSNGNFDIVQNVTSTGRVCVDVMTGQPTGRMLPDCMKLNQCSEDDILGMESHLNFFLDDTETTEEHVEKIRRTNSLRQKTVTYYDALIGAPTSIGGGNRSALLPVQMCHPDIGVYYGRLCNYERSPECWCVDLYGNEIEGTRAGGNETQVICGQTLNYQEPETEMYTTGNDTELEFEINSTIELPCSITAASVDAYVTWSTPKGYLEQITIVDKRIKMIGDGITDFTLRISNLIYSDAGWYRCDLSNYLSGFGGSSYYYIIVRS